MTRGRLLVLTPEGRATLVLFGIAIALGFVLGDESLLAFGLLLLAVWGTSSVVLWRAAAGVRVALDRVPLVRAGHPVRARMMVQSQAAIGELLAFPSEAGEEPLVLAPIPGGSLPVDFAIEEPPLRRGYRAGRRYDIAVERPLGLWRVRSALAFSPKVLVLPKRLSPRALMRLLPRRVKDFELHLESQRGEGEFHGLRPLRQGEGGLRVDAKKSLRVGKLIAKECHAAGQGEVWLGLGVGRPLRDPLRFEHAISECAALLARWSQQGIPIQFALGQERALRVRPHSAQDLLEAERALALVDARVGWPAPPRHSRELLCVLVSGGGEPTMEYPSFVVWIARESRDRSKIGVASPEAATASMVASKEDPSFATAGSEPNP